MAERRITTLKAQLDESQWALEKMTDESSKTEADFSVQVVAVEWVLNAERARVERLERDIAVETYKRQQFLVERLKTRETASYQLAKDEESLQVLHSKVAPVTAELGEWREKTAETAKKFMVSKAGFMSNSGLSKAAQEEKDAKTEKISNPLKHLAAKSAKLPQLSAKNGGLNDELSSAI